MTTDPNVFGAGTDPKAPEEVKAGTDPYVLAPSEAKAGTDPYVLAPSEAKVGTDPYVMRAAIDQSVPSPETDPTVGGRQSPGR